MNWRLLSGQRYAFYPARLALSIVLRDSGPLTHVHWGAPLEIRNIERLLAIAAVGRADQSKERVVLGNRHLLTLTKGPAGRRKVAAKHSNFTYKRFAHTFSFSIL